MSDIDQDLEPFDDSELGEQPLEGDENSDSGKYDRLLGSDSSKYKLSGMFKEWFLDYSSYVILQRAVPHIVDGLKPVQRRVLHAMSRIDDGRYTKVANIVGQAMQYHPHGDASILGALVQLGQKGYLIDCQGNWGNILTGDSNAAPRYIEARLSKFAKEVVFDDKVTNWMTSYDGRNKEPIELPVRFPLLLAQGTEGIAVGMASKILPHNFNELMDASVSILEGKDFEIYPDFPTGGSIDCSKYMDGHRGGVVKVRAKIEKIDKNTISINEIPYGSTSHSLIESILRAKDKGKIKIKKIEDMTTEKVEILIHLPADVSPDKTIDALYAFTDCETTINPNACVIVDNKPQFLSVKDILIYDTNHTKDLLEQELRIRLGELENDWHYTSLERIFFEYGVYKLLESKDFPSWEDQKEAILAKMQEYRDQVRREIVMEDIDRLVEKPVRKISRFDTKAIDEKITAIEEQMAEVRDQIDHIVRYTIDWFKGLKKKYGKDYPRQTEITAFETIAVTKVVNNNAKLYANMEEGFVGIGLKRDDNGIFIGLLYVGVFNRNDTRTIYNVIYREGKTSIYYAKRFAVTGITRDREYDITTGAPGSTILWFTANHNGEAETVRVNLRAKPKLKKLSFEYDFSELAIKGKTSRGNLVSKNVIQKIVLKAKGVSTIGGKDIWYDPDIQKLDEDGRGIHLGQFSGEDKVLAVFKNGTYYTTSFDLSNRYQGDLLFIEKLDEMKTFTALYWDAGAKAFYVKRFSFTPSDNTPFLFIAEGKNSFLVDVSADERPQVKVTFKGKSAHREPEIIDAESFIGKKGITAKGKKCSSLEVKKVEFIASEVAPEVVEETTPAPAPEPVAEATPALALEPAPEETPEPATEVVEKPAPAPKAKKKPASKPKPAETIEPKQITPLDIDLGEEETNITVGKLDLDLPDIGEMDLLEPVARKRTSRKSVKKDPDEPPAEDLTLF